MGKENLYISCVNQFIKDFPCLLNCVKAEKNSQRETGIIFIP